MDDKSLEQLNLHIRKVIDEVSQMTIDFGNLDTFAHYNQFLNALAPSGLLGALRENAEHKRLMKYLNTKIYKGMSFDEIGHKLVEIAEDLSKTQIEVQKQTKPSDECYYGNVKSIIEALEACRNAWESISPKVAMEELTRSDGEKIQLGPQIEYWIQCELVKMDLPKEYDRIKKSVSQVQNGTGCMVIIAISMASLLAACSML